MSNIFNAPSGSPGRKPANVMQYPDMPEVGGMTRRSIPKSGLSLKKPGSAGTRSVPGTKG